MRLPRIKFYPGLQRNGAWIVKHSLDWSRQTIAERALVNKAQRFCSNLNERLNG